MLSLIFSTKGRAAGWQRPQTLPSILPERCQLRLLASHSFTVVALWRQSLVAISLVIYLFIALSIHLNKLV